MIVILLTILCTSTISICMQPSSKEIKFTVVEKLNLLRSKQCFKITVYSQESKYVELDATYDKSTNNFLISMPTDYFERDQYLNHTISEENGEQRVEGELSWRCRLGRWEQKDRDGWYSWRREKRSTPPIIDGILKNALNALKKHVKN